MSEQPSTSGESEDRPEDSATAGAGEWQPAPDAEAAPSPPAPAPVDIPAFSAPDRAPAAPVAAAAERPELTIGGAFIGGLALALILKRLAR